MRPILPEPQPPGSTDNPRAEWIGGTPERPGRGGNMVLRSLLGVPRRHKVLVISVATVVVAATVFLIERERPVYRTTAAIRIADARSALTSGVEDAEMPERATRPMLSHVQVLRSRTLAGMVVDSLGLRLEPSYEGFSSRLVKDVQVDPTAPPDTLELQFHADGFGVRSRSGEVRGQYGRPVRLDGVTFTISAQPQATSSAWVIHSRDRAIDRLLRELKVKQRPMTNVIDVTYTANRRAMAQAVANAVVMTFRRLDAEAAQDQSRRRRIFLEAQVTHADSLLREAQVALITFRQRVQGYSSREKLSSRQQELMALETQSEGLQAERSTYRALLEQIGDSAGTARQARIGALAASSVISRNPTVGRLWEQLGGYQTTRDSLTSGRWRRAVSDPDVVRLDEMIRSTEGRLLDAVDAHLAGLDGRIALLADMRARSAGALAPLPTQEAEEVALTRGAESIRSLADHLRQEYQKARMAEAVEIGRVEIMDLAALPYEPLPRLRLFKAGLGLLLGLLLGGGVAFLLELRNTSIRQREEIDGTLHIPTLGVIPNATVLAPEPENGHRRFRALLRTLSDQDRRPAGGSSELITLAPTPSVAQEAYRILRTRLLFSGATGVGKCLVVTSAAPREGKTTTAANLAVALAAEGMRVLLVDCDLRRPRLHRIFRTSRTPGLAQVLTSPDSPPVVPVRETAVNGLLLLPSGGTPSNPAALLTGHRVERFLRDMSEAFDLVILDTPPVLAVADAAIVGALADSVLLVVRAGKTERREVEDALDQLASVGANVVGTVLNDPAGELPAYEYFSSYAPIGAN